MKSELEHPTAKTKPWRGIGLATANVGLATFFIMFAYGHAVNFLERPRLSVFLIVVTETIVAVLLLIRRDPDETRHTWKTWITTTGGTCAPFFFRPLDLGDDMLIGQILQTSGALLQIAALVALNRSLGLLPAHRGIKSEGLYRFVRHPLYMAYVITFAGYWINNMSAHNAIVAVLGIVFIVFRISCEEELLLNYKRYADYASKTRWRLIPSIW